MTKKKTRSFEESLKRLQEISELLDSDNIGLEESIKLYEEGIELSKECYDKLNQAELKISELKNKLETGITGNIDESE